MEKNIIEKNSEEHENFQDNSFISNTSEILTNNNKENIHIVNKSNSNTLEDNSNKENKIILEKIVNSEKIQRKDHSFSLLPITQEQKRKRNFGIDIARILSIIFIINHHILYHGGPLG